MDAQLGASPGKLGAALLAVENAVWAGSGKQPGVGSRFLLPQDKPLARLRTTLVPLYALLDCDQIHQDV